MLSIPDMALLGAAALLLFGPEQLPRVARKAGTVMREIQNTSQSFIREMERAADLQDAAAKPYEAPYEPAPYEPAPYDATPYDAAPYDATAYGEKSSDEAAAARAATHEPPAPDPERPAGLSTVEKLAEPRPALDQISAAAEPAPQPDHPAHL
jgi:sec-independent protein translocase protein TatA